MHPKPRARAAALSIAALITVNARADIMGFPIPGWQMNQWDSASASPVNPPQSITLTTGTAGQSRSAFYTVRQDITQFEASFTYSFAGNAGSRMGAAFVLHNAPNGATTVARGNFSGVPTNLGYNDGVGTFGAGSLAVTLESGYASPGSSASGVYTNGDFGGGSSATSPLSFSSGNPIDVNVSYDGFLLRMSARDTVTGSLFNAPTIAINLPSILNNGLAFVGFTGSTNANAGTSQILSNFRFTSVPEPASLIGLTLAVIGLRRR